MKISTWLTKKIMTRLMPIRPPDFVISHEGEVYLKRWWVIPRNKIFNIYFHEFLHSDDDRALHDHPWAWCSILLQGTYTEVTKSGSKAYTAGSVRFHKPTFAHRIVLTDGSCYTLFITGPRVREWGFLCPKGWRSWKIFTDPSTGGATVGRGCD